MTITSKITSTIENWFTSLSYYQMLKNVITNKENQTLKNQGGILTQVFRNVSNNTTLANRPENVSQFDLMGMIFIILALRALNLNQNFSLVYFWSP